MIPCAGEGLRRRTVVMMLVLVTALVLVGLGAGVLPARGAEPVLEPDGLSGTVEPMQGPPGTVFAFRVMGLVPNERVGTWLVDPRGGQHDLEEQVFADGTGQASWTWAAPGDAYGGAWTMHGRSFATREEVIVSFVVEGEAIPHTRQASTMVLPDASGEPGTTFTFVARGEFQPWEQVGSWFIQPDGTRLDADQGISADGNGQIYRVWTAPMDAMEGDWVFRARGINTLFQVDIAFHIDRSGYTLPPVPGYEVAPARGPRGTVFWFRADGFVPGERVGMWLILPDGRRQDYRPREWMFADAERGEFVWEWTAPADAPTGSWTMAIRGVSSRVQWNIPFVIEDVVAAPTPVPQPALWVVPERAPRGSTFRFAVSGYLPGEKVFFWAVNPDGRPVPNHRELEADEQGAAAWEWTVEPDEPPGRWVMVSRGDVGRQEGQVTFEVTAPEGLPDAVRVEPARGTPSTTFHFFASGFSAREEVDIWLTGPHEEPRRFDVSFDVREDLRTDEQGQVWWSWTAPENVPGGTWQMTARGADSRVERVVVFGMVRETPLPLPYSVSPASGPPGTVFHFSAEDVPTARAAFWLTAPDGSVIPTDHTDFRERWTLTVGDDGVVAWDWTAPPDAQRGVWLMVLRNRSEDPALDWSRADDPEEWEHELARSAEARRDSVIEFREYVIRFTVE
ncbi:MAG: hypothetical protein HC884_11605 [Chloroflexaceae bacterium]|nr:hypothetical protein [Chloroflexaceae bacterium]